MFNSLLEIQEIATILAILIMVVWYVSRWSAISISNRAIISSPDFFYKRARNGLMTSGMWIILSTIPFLGFIFMWFSASSASKIAGATRSIGQSIRGALDVYSFIAVLTGFGLIIISIGTYSGANPTAILDAVYLTHLWFTVYLASVVLALVSVSPKNFGIASFLLGILFQMLQVLIYSLTALLIFPIFIGLMFVSAGAATSSSRVKFIKNGGRVGSGSQGQKTPQQPVKVPAQPQTAPNNPANVNTEAEAGRKTDVDRKIDPRELIAMVGPPASGKTTTLSYFFHFMSDIESKTNLSMEVNPGIELMEEYLRRIISEHKFPELTAMDKVGEVVFNFSRKKRFGINKTYLRVNDIAGERFNALQGGKEKVRSALMNTRFEYILRARGYLIMIDCSTFRDWATKDLEYMRILNSVIRSRIEKSTPRIAFVFTKTDTLPSAVINYSPIQLLEILKNTNAFVRKYVKNPAAFKIYIKTERDNDGTIVPKLDVDVGGRLDIKFDPEFNEGFLYMAQWIAEVGGI